jgi:hypothetical protein
MDLNKALGSSLVKLFIYIESKEEKGVIHRAVK